MSYYAMSRRGGSDDDPGVDRLREILNELDEDDLEHACAALSHESGWTLSAYQTGAIEWVNVAEDDPTERHMESVPREKVLDLWLKLAHGEIDAIEAEPWLPGRVSLPMRSREEIESWQRQIDREFYDRLGPEDASRPCRNPGCSRGAVALSVFCRIHHFESQTRCPCPFKD